MISYDKVVSLLPTKPTKDEEEIILSLCKFGQSPFAIADFISRGRLRNLILAKLQALNITDLTDDELQWIEELLGSSDSIDTIVNKIKEYRAKNSQPNIKSDFKIK